MRFYVRANRHLPMKDTDPGHFQGAPDSLGRFLKQTGHGSILEKKTFRALRRMHGTNSKFTACGGLHNRVYVAILLQPAVALYMNAERATSFTHKRS